MAIQVVLQGFSIGGQRRKLFNKAFFDKNFPSMKNYPKGGYPDTGNGRYAAKLSHEDWERYVLTGVRLGEMYDGRIITTNSMM